MPMAALLARSTTKYVDSVDFHVLLSNWSQALQSVFKGRLLDVRKGETAVDRCDVTLQDGQDEAACRFVFKMICDQG